MILVPEDTFELVLVEGDEEHDGDLAIMAMMMVMMMAMMMVMMMVMMVAMRSMMETPRDMPSRWRRRPTHWPPCCWVLDKEYKTFKS